MKRQLNEVFRVFIFYFVSLIFVYQYLEGDLSPSHNLIQIVLSTGFLTVIKAGIFVFLK